MLNVGGQAGPLFVTAIFFGKIAYKVSKITEVSVKFYFKGWSVAD
jgi:hypothetical protein